MTTLSESSLEAVQTVSGGGSSAQKAKRRPSQSLAQAETPVPSSALAQKESLQTSTATGSQSLTNGGGNVQTAQSASLIPSSTLAGTLEWALGLLQRRNLADFGVVRDANGEPVYYEVRLDAGKWQVVNNVLALKDEAK